MKKNFFSLYIMIIVSVLSSSFVSCGSDKKDDVGDDSKAIIGTWVETNETSNTKLSLVLKADGNGYWLVDQNGKVSNDGDFTYTYKNNIVTMRYKDDDEKPANGYVEEFTVLEVTSQKLVILYDQRRRTFYKE